MSAQLEAARTFLKQHGGELAAEFREVESGRRRDNERPQLAAALALCRKTKSKLLIARLDRLARNAAFLLSLRDSGVTFVCCDNPAADRFTVAVLAVVAEREAELISERTRAALQAAKRRGIKLGNPKLAKARKEAARSTQKRAEDYAARMAPIIVQLKSKGHVTGLKQTAEVLNVRGFTTPNGKAFTRHSVRRLLARIARKIRP